MQMRELVLKTRYKEVTRMLKREESVKVQGTLEHLLQRRIANGDMFALGRVNLRTIVQKFRLNESQAYKLSKVFR